MPEDTLLLVRELARLMPDQQIARLLNRAGKPTGRGNGGRYPPPPATGTCAWSVGRINQQSIQWTVGITQGRRSDLRVKCRGLELFVPQKDLNHPDIDTLLQ